MNEFAALLFVLLAGLLMIQATMTFAFVSALRRSATTQPVPDSLRQPYLPKVTVILSLRGADPFLTDCVLGLVNQNYPCYQVRIVVDSREDPAWQVVSQTLRHQASSHVQVSALKEKRLTCALKCSALIQAGSDLDDDCEVVAIADSDVIAHPNWLRELVRPLASTKVGAASGNRWYVPVWNQWGSILRYIFNANAVAQMYVYNMPFGGSVAFKADILRHSPLLKRWERSIGDTPVLARTIREQGLEIAFVPMLMGNREGCKVASCIRWIKRQILMTRLYHPRSRWLSVIGHGLLISLVPALTLGLLVVALSTGHAIAAAWAIGGLLTYLIGSTLLLGMIEISARKVLQLPGQPVTEFSVKNVGQLLIAIPLLQSIYPATLLSVMFMRAVEWRGITYQINNPWNIRLVEYWPYRSLQQLVDSNASL
jgi:cellulose synthase/poly-beta-1,6-N-acetylglucosamine synthase-like glycosyltransferase